LLAIAPAVEFVQFLDGDCELDRDWLGNGLAFLRQNPRHAVVCGRVRERDPDRSVFNRLCDWEWQTPAGEVKACGGNALVRVSAFREVGGFREELIAGEEPEMCLRLRQAGWQVHRLATEMVLHDAAMTRFSQWWLRTTRSGHAFAEGAWLHGLGRERHWVRETLRAVFFGGLLPLTAIVLSATLDAWFLLLLLLYPVHVLRLSREQGGFTRAFYLVLGRFPEFLGVLRFVGQTAGACAAPLIEYKVMRVAYLVNQYPKVSHTFIRREILALEGARAHPCCAWPPAAGTMPWSTRRTRKSAGRRTTCCSKAGRPCSPRHFGSSLPHPAVSCAPRGAPLPWRGCRRGPCRCTSPTWRRPAACASSRATRASGTCTPTSEPTRPKSRCCAANSAGPAFSFTVHGPEEFDMPRGLHLGDKVRQATFVAAVSSFGRSQLYRWIPHADWPKVKVVHCGIDEGFARHTHAAAPESRTVVCVGRLCEQKGQSLLLAAAREMARRGIDFQLVLAGDGEMRAQLEGLIDAYDLRDRVRITGWVSGERVRSLLQQSRGLILPSFAEGLPVVVMEAMALARPVIGTHIAGIPELVRHGQGRLAGARR
jgi:hypothetical protein